MGALRRTRCSPLFLAATRRLDRTVAPSAQTQKELIDHSFAPKRTARIPDRVGAERFRPAVDREEAKQSLGLQGNLLSFDRRLDPQKGLMFLLQAWAIVAVK